jgi:hypothetical protein
MAPINDITGQRFGRLIALKPMKNRARDRHVQWFCRCDCGTEKIIVGNNLRSGAVNSCGCFRKEYFKELYSTHKLSKTRTYKVWCYAKTRCTNPNIESWHRYGGRGISMCEKWWNSYEAFLEDMGECPAGMTLERIDNDGDYEPNNCKWATWKEQYNNTARNIYVFYKGEKLTMAQYCELRGLKYAMFRWRYHEKKYSRAKATILTQIAMKEMEEGSK